MIVAMKNTPDPTPSSLLWLKDMHNQSQPKPPIKPPSQKAAQPDHSKQQGNPEHKHHQTQPPHS